MPPFGDCDNADAAPDQAGERPTARLNECCVTVFVQIAKGLLRTTFAQEHFQEKWGPVFRPKMRQAQKA
jgi:hypothetical protein